MAYSELFIWILSSIFTIFFLAASFSSFLEKELRAGIILSVTTLISAAAFLSLQLMLPQGHIIQMFIIGIILTVLVLFTLPIKGCKGYRFEIPVGRIHEADAVLSRRRLNPGTPEYKSYYEAHPEFKEADDKAREKPGLLSDGSSYYDPGTFAAAKANFILTDHLHSLAKDSKHETASKLNGLKTRKFIETWLKSTGAHSVGFTALKDYHLYTHKGRGPDKGKKIITDLPHAIAITVEMDHDMMKPAPAGTTVMESAEQYLQSGILASKLTAYIKSLGYHARAHIDGMYEVICPLVAADAGLGVIGRMGLLMTPALGPRVRIVVVTTDIPLEYKEIKHDLSMLDFCNRCRKCAKVCPADAISHDPLTEIDGNQRWKINSEGCYLFWTISGTDCGRCVISCPYAHPDNWFHRLIRWGIKNNLVFRVIAVKLDDVFYGKRPKIRPLPDWVKLI